MPKIRIFLDTTAIVAGIWSDRGGGRVLLELGEAGAIALLTSHLALRELEAAIRRRAPEVLAALALLLDRAQLTILGTAGREYIASLTPLVDQPAEARILASAMSGQVEYFVTLDPQRLLANPELAAALPFELGTPGECLNWLRYRLRGQ